jgi:hypothetical protein
MLELFFDKIFGDIFKHLVFYLAILSGFFIQLAFVYLLKSRFSKACWCVLERQVGLFSPL